MRAVLLLAGSFVFGALDQYVGSVPSWFAWGISASQLSAPWLLIAFVGGWSAARPRRAIVLGFACTYAALLGYALMTLSPIEGAHLDWAAFVGFCRSSWQTVVGGLVTGPLFGWFGHRWRVARAWIGAALTAAAFCLEPLAESVGRPGLIRSTIVNTVEVLAGLAMLGYVAVVLLAVRRAPAPK